MREDLRKSGGRDGQEIEVQIKGETTFAAVNTVSVYMYMKKKIYIYIYSIFIDSISLYVFRN